MDSDHLGPYIDFGHLGLIRDSGLQALFEFRPPWSQLTWLYEDFGQLGLGFSRWVSLPLGGTTLPTRAFEPLDLFGQPGLGLPRSGHSP